MEGIEEVVEEATVVAEDVTAIDDGSEDAEALLIPASELTVEEVSASVLADEGVGEGGGFISLAEG